MYLIVGLGNPENEYENTRHNMGFSVINKLAKECDIKIVQSKFNGLWGSGTICEEKVILVKPQTYMNLSGECAVKFRNFYKISNNNIIIICDDIDLKIGDIRIRKKGSSGTHNGMKSIVEKFETEEFTRVRVGIGAPEFKEDIINYVTQKIPQKDMKQLDESAIKAAEAIIEILKNGIDSAMNKFN